MKAFIAWVTTSLLLLGASYFGFEEGAFEYIWTADVSKLSFACLALFLYGYGFLGKLLYNRSQGKKISEADLDFGFEASETAMAVGMLGTVIGFILMTGSLTGIDFTGTDSVKDLFSLVTHGISTALYTTAAGITFSLALRAPYYLTQRLVQNGSKKV